VQQCVGHKCAAAELEKPAKQQPVDDSDEHDRQVRQPSQNGEILPRIARRANVTATSRLVITVR
jgi:hypothetical protein